MELAYLQRALVGLYVLLMNGVTGAQPVPGAPGTLNDSRNAPVALVRVPTHGIVMGNLPVNLERTQLREVAERITGSFTGQHRGDAGASRFWICFTSAGARASRVWLVSDAEMGGPDHLITEIRASMLTSHEAATTECPTLPRRFRSVAFDNGLWLGASVTQLGCALGVASRPSSGWRRYQYSGKTSAAKPQGSTEFDTLTSFEVRLQKGIVTAIRASQVTSN